MALVKKQQLFWNIFMQQSFKRLEKDKNENVLIAKDRN